MDDQTQYQHPEKQIIKLSSKAILSQVVPNSNHIIYALANQNFCLIDHENKTKLYEAQSVHQGRIGSIRFKDNLLITGGYDNTIKLFDTRNWQLAHTFQKIPSRFTSIDKSQHILAASTNSNIVFWDLRKMKQRSEFKQSFNGQITWIRFEDEVNTNLMACSIDGMINMFDLTQPNQEEAFNWCYKIMQAPSVLSTGRNGSALIRTVDHNIYKIVDGDQIGKISPNKPETPKHVLFSQFKEKTNYQLYEYFAWAPEQKIVEHWSGHFLDKNNHEKCTQYLNHVHDIEILDVIYSKFGKCIGIFTDQQGKVYKKYFSQQRKIFKNIQQKSIENGQVDKMSQKTWKPSKNEIYKNQPQVKSLNQNGYMIQKPASSFSKQKKFRPY